MTIQNKPTIHNGNTIYNTGAGGGVGNVELFELFSGNIGYTETAVLSDDYTKYDFIMLEWKAVQGDSIFLMTNFQKTSELTLNSHIGISNDLYYAWGIFQDTTHFYIDFSNSSFKLQHIYGFKII